MPKVGSECWKVNVRDGKRLKNHLHYHSIKRKIELDKKHQRMLNLKTDFDEDQKLGMDLMSLTTPAAN